MNIEQIAKDLDFEVEDIEMLLEVFLESACENLEKLYEAIEQNDYETIHKSAHAIKGSASNLLFDDISKKALFVEKSAKDKEPIEYKNYVNELQDIVEKIKMI